VNGENAGSFDSSPKARCAVAAAVAGSATSRADGELAALLHSLDALVPAERGARRAARSRLVAARDTSAPPLRTGRQPSATAAADAHTSPPSDLERAARSPTRCGGGSSPDHAPREGKSRLLSPRTDAASARRARRRPPEETTRGRPPHGAPRHGGHGSHRARSGTRPGLREPSSARRR